MTDKKPNQALQDAIEKLYKEHGVQAATLSYLSPEHVGSMLYQLEVDPSEEREFLDAVDKMLGTIRTAISHRRAALGLDMTGTRPMEGGCQDGSSSALDYMKKGAHWRKDDTCSYCGGLDPVKVLDLLANHHARVEPCPEKTYKFYLHEQDDGSKRNRQHKVYLWHFSQEQVDQLNMRPL